MGSSLQQREWVIAELDAHEQKLTRYALRLLGDENLAHDAVQHAFLRLCDQTSESIGAYAAPWLFKVVRNRAMDLLHERGRNRRLEEAPEARTHRDDDPAQTAERSDLQEHLRKVVGLLPDEQRETLDLWAEGFSYREIAEISGKTEGHLRVLVHRAISTLRGNPATLALLSGRSRPSTAGVRA